MRNLFNIFLLDTKRTEAVVYIPAGFEYYEILKAVLANNNKYFLVQMYLTIIIWTNTFKGVNKMLMLPKTVG